MKRTSSMRYVPGAEAQELYLCTINNEKIYPQVQATIKALRKKYAQGIYNQQKAIDAWYNIATVEARMYDKDFGYWFNVTERFTAAVDLEDYFREDIMGIDN